MNASHLATCWQYSSNKTRQNPCSHGDFDLVKDNPELSHSTLTNSTEKYQIIATVSAMKIIWET